MLPSPDKDTRKFFLAESWEEDGPQAFLKGLWLEPDLEDDPPYNQTPGKAARISRDETLEQFNRRELIRADGELKKAKHYHAGSKWSDYYEGVKERFSNWLLKNGYELPYVPVQTPPSNSISQQLFRQSIQKRQLLRPSSRLETSNEAPDKMPDFKIVEESRTVIRYGVQHRLTPNQFKVIQVLYKAENRKEPWVSWATIKKDTGISAEKMYEVFRHNRDVRKALIQYDFRKRLYRLRT